MLRPKMEYAQVYGIGARVEITVGAYGRDPLNYVATVNFNRFRRKLLHTLRASRDAAGTIHLLQDALEQAS
jgi:hypothetical protein